MPNFLYELLYVISVVTEIVLSISVMIGVTIYIRRNNDGKEKEDVNM